MGIADGQKEIQKTKPKPDTIGLSEKQVPFVERTENRRKSGKYLVTAESCPVCIELQKTAVSPLTNVYYRSMKLSPSSYPVHNWYSFVHSYSPKFVDYEIKRSRISPDSWVLDPFAGAGTTLVECKSRAINSIGLDALEFLVLVSNIKTTWDVNIKNFRATFERVINNARYLIPKLRIETKDESLEKFAGKETDNDCLFRRPELLRESYVSPRPLLKLVGIKRAIAENAYGRESPEAKLLKLAFAAIVVPSSNIRFGPGFGLIKPVKDTDVLRLFRRKVERMTSDLKKVQKTARTGSCLALKDDTREMTSAARNRLFDHVITSPPYPQEHDYSRQLRLELIFLDYLSKRSDLRNVKKPLLRASTKNIYSEDDDRQYICRFKELVGLVDRIEKRVEDTKGTSGFEKLYGTLVGEYFGGMYRSLQQIYNVLETGGTASLLVGDSHCFKMVHIETAKLLAKLGLDVGFKSYDIELWLNIRSTAHDYPIQENILRLHK